MREMRAAAVTASLALLAPPAAAFRLRNGASLVPEAPEELSAPPRLGYKLSVAQRAEGWAGPGATIHYFSTFHDSGPDGAPVARDAVRQMRRKIGPSNGADDDWEHGQWLDGKWRARDEDIPWWVWENYNKSHDRSLGPYCKYDCKTRCGFTWDDAAAKTGPSCQGDIDCVRPLRSGSWPQDASYGCFDDLPDYKRGVLGECVSKDTRVRSDAYCAVVCGSDPSSCDVGACICTKSPAWDVGAPIQSHDDSVNAKDMHPKGPVLLDHTRKEYDSTPSGLPACRWRPPKGCSNASQYECFDAAISPRYMAEYAGKCSNQNWFGNDKCLRSCIHVSTLSKAPYYALWIDGTQERPDSRGERMPRYEHEESRLTPERRGIRLRGKSDVLMSRMCKSVENRFMGVTLYSPAFEGKARRLVRSCERVGICCKATNLPTDAFGSEAPEGSEEFRFRTIAIKPSFILSEMEANELPVVYLECARPIKPHAGPLC